VRILAFARDRHTLLSGCLRVRSRAMTTLAVHTSDEALPGARPPGVTVERVRVFATAARDVEDRGHP